jgi:hypothetical protein
MVDLLLIQVEVDTLYASLWFLAALIVYVAIPLGIMLFVRSLRTELQGWSFGLEVAKTAH